MTIRNISTATLTTTDAVVKVFKGLNVGPHPGLNDVLPTDHADALLQRMAQRTTRRKAEVADAAAQLLEEFRAGKHQNGHVEPTRATEVRTVAAEKPARQRTAKPTAQQVTPEPTRTRRSVWPTVSMLDIVYLSTIATAVYGLWFTLREMGAAFAVPYVFISWHALRMAKSPENRKTAQYGIAAVVVLEVVTFFIHLVLFNLRTVQAAKANILPFEYSLWGTLEAPFTIACILAGLFSASGIYAVSVTFSLTSEKRNAAELARKNAEQQAAHVAELRAALEDSARQWFICSGQNYFDHERAGGLAEKYFTLLKSTE